MENFDTIILSYLPYLTVGAAFLYQWLLSTGDLRRAYKIAIIVYLGYIIVETDLALRHPDQFNIIIFNAVNVWSIIMAVKGLRRLKREAHGI